MRHGHSACRLDYDDPPPAHCAYLVLNGGPARLRAGAMRALIADDGALHRKGMAVLRRRPRRPWGGPRGVYPGDSSTAARRAAGLAEGSSASRRDQISLAATRGADERRRRADFRLNGSRRRADVRGGAQKVGRRGGREAELFRCALGGRWKIASWPKSVATAGAIKLSAPRPGPRGRRRRFGAPRRHQRHPGPRVSAPARWDDPLAEQLLRADFFSSFFLFLFWKAGRRLGLPRSSAAGGAGRRRRARAVGAQSFRRTDREARERDRSRGGARVTFARTADGRSERATAHRRAGPLGRPSSGSGDQRGEIDQARAFAQTAIPASGRGQSEGPLREVEVQAVRAAERDGRRGRWSRALACARQ